MADGCHEFGYTALLLKSAKPDDEYHDTIASKCHLKVFSIPVLDFSFKNLELFKDCLLEIDQYSGLIFTSPRSVEAFSRSLFGIDLKSNTPVKTSLQRLKVFVVGKATEKAAVKAFGDADILQKICKGGNEGSAENLAKFILSLEEIRNDSRALLFICGNIAKNTLPSMLENANVRLKSLCVYDTHPHPKFCENFENFLITHGDPTVIVFFSPSGAEFYLEDIRGMVENFQQMKIIVIGQTTANFFHQKKYHVHGISEKPNAESLSQSIKDVIDQLQS
ncbi:uroporphyrinogen-III synthase-like [Rhopilema esculentum]|uniref:uroporphyrinogen-III synthase-like n=1 Tax=Rhopilema esculentum TaxID=499914 RepID=UPI0031D6FB76|eukprot:gene604-10297_t